MSAREDIQHWYGADAPNSLALLLDTYRDEVLREAAEKIRREMTNPGDSYDASRWNRVVGLCADPIDPDKED